MNEIQQSGGPRLTEIFSEWGILKQPGASILIHEDWKILNLTTVDLDEEVWSRFFLAVSRKYKAKRRDGTGLELESMLRGENLSTGNNHRKKCSKLIIQIYYLKYFIFHFAERFFFYKCLKVLFTEFSTFRFSYPGPSQTPVSLPSSRAARKRVEGLSC